MTNKLPICIIAPTPGAEGRSVEWTSVCRNRHDFLFIEHNQVRNSVRPFIVSVQRWRGPGVYQMPFQISTHFTLEAALKAARRYATSYALNQQVAA